MLHHLSSMRSNRGNIIHGLSIAVACTGLAVGTAFAQNPPPVSNPDNPAANSAAPATNQNQRQPQGQTGPTNTTSGGAPASSPQGDTPAGMQPTPNEPEKVGSPRK